METVKPTVIVSDSIMCFKLLYHLVPFFPHITVLCWKVCFVKDIFTVWAQKRITVSLGELII